jgi:hypothetical protein
MPAVFINFNNPGIYVHYNLVHYITNEVISRLLSLYNYTKCSTRRKHKAIKAWNYAITSTSSFNEKIPRDANQQFKF